MAAVKYPILLILAEPKPHIVKFHYLTFIYTSLRVIEFISRNIRTEFHKDVLTTIPVVDLFGWMNTIMIQIAVSAISALDTE